MCNVYEPATEDYLQAEWTRFQASGITGAPPSSMAYKLRLGPRDTGPFITSHDVMLGQWGMIRPNAPTRTEKDPKGRPLMTNNARSETMATRATFRDPWKNGQRCLIPATSWDEPYWGNNAFNTWWRFHRQDGDAWMLAGLWNTWTDKATGEVVPSYTMITMNCDAHPLLKLMHKPEKDKEGTILPPEKQDKRTVVPIDAADWSLWLTGNAEDALSLIQLPLMRLFKHAAVDPAKQVDLPIKGSPQKTDNTAR